MSENYKIVWFGRKFCKDTKNPCAFPVLAGHSGYIVCDSG